MSFLIALLILGVIATFTIPKVLIAQQNATFKSISKESLGMIAGAYTSYQLNNVASANTKIADLTPYMNYVKVDTVSLIDDRPGRPSIDCSTASTKCLLLHSGAMMSYVDDIKFNGTTSLNAIPFKVDPNGKYDGTAQAITIWLYFNGRLTSYCCIEPNTTFYGTGVTVVTNPDPTAEPTWFNWN